MKILVAEDDRDTREGLREVFSSEGYEVVLAADGNEALRQFRTCRPDLICLDIMMPGKSGYDACRAIRKEDGEVPILFLSAKSEEIDKVLGLELGGDDYVVKPFGVREVAARVKALLRRRAGEKERTGDTAGGDFIIADLEVRAGELRAWRGEQAFDLSDREVRILRTLAQQPGKVVSRDTLFDRAWGESYLPGSRTLDQTISQLRKKVEIDPANPRIIRTVHSAGYRWEPQ
jgi:DNA-binding response OmpR family regulator